LKKLLFLRSTISESRLTNFLNTGLKGNVQVISESLHNLIFSFSQDGCQVTIGDQDVRDFDAVWFRQTNKRDFPLVLALSNILKENKVRFFDPFWAENFSHDKLSTLVKFSLAGLPVPLTIFVSHKRLKDSEKNIIKFLGLPLVAKEIHKNRGEGVYLIEKEEDFNQLLHNSHEEYLFQPFLPNDGDYRLLVMGKRVVSWEKRFRKTDKFRNNASLGGTETFFPLKDLPKDWQKISLSAAAIAGLAITGVDLVVSQKDQKCYLLEINRSPQFTFDHGRSPEVKAVKKFLSSLA